MIYGNIYGLFYAVIKNSKSAFPPPNYVTLQTLYSFSQYMIMVRLVDYHQLLNYQLLILKVKVPANLTKEEIFETYPEYIL